ncbi:DUF1735 and LamG domain-containing protein [Alistipes sp.]|uniref:DUF1735 and LamG domain-containing protein n=1 Tax=Alistipes sp. TaxID=1872444 RepID=UPI0025B94B59|nr:DUF1735 and LamG domain-containing protein [Alistipes sp.]
MKLHKLLTPLMLMTAVLTGCQDSADTYPALYMTDAQVRPDRSMTIDELPAKASFTVSSSVVVDHAVNVELAVCPELLEGYNAQYGKNYQLPPLESFSLSTNEASILAGYSTSSEVVFSLNSMDAFKEGVTYCVPISIKSVSGSLSILEPSRTLFLVLKTPVISKAIYLGGSNIYNVAKFQENSDLSALKELTLETRVYVKNFQPYDPYISSIMGIEGECGVRFGDVKIPNNCLQICHGDYQPAAADKPFATDTWYHVAAVWTGSSWDIYIDGQYATGVATQGETINLTSDNSGGFYLGASYGGGRPLDGYVAECRVWTRALSQSEIANNMNYVDPASDGLLAYWRMNEWEVAAGGNRVKDLTGHGYDAIGGSSQPQMIDTKWM